MEKVRKSDLLILRGVYPKDFEICESGGSLSTRPQQVIYTEMPRRFVSVELWPTFSNLKCWECDQFVKDYPAFIPLNPEKNKNQEDTCDIFGHFDSWNCACRYILREFPPVQQWDILRNLCLFESKFTGIYREKIPPAPPKVLMKAYCGDRGLTLGEYREKTAIADSDYSLGIFRLEDHCTGGKVNRIHHVKHL